MSHRVLMTADAVGGVWTFCLELARGLVARGGRVALAVMGPAPSAAQRAEAAGVPHLELHVGAYRLEWMEDPWDDVRKAGAWLLDLERRLQPDVVHLNGFCHGALPWRAPVLVTAHSCVRSWWRAVHGCDPPPVWDRYTTDVARGLRAAALVTAPTAAMRAALEACYGPLPRTEVIANGRSDLPGAAGVRGATPEKEALVLTAGRLWDEAKNIRALCAAAPHVPWPICLAGEAGPRARPMASAVRVLGYLDRDDLASWMQRAAIYALPARYEPFGLSALEAALARCALVLGDIPSLREVWEDAALYVAPADHRALAAVLTRLARDPALRREMAARAAARARLFTPQRMARAFGEAYTRLVAERAAVDGAGVGRAVPPRAAGGPTHT